MNTNAKPDQSKFRMRLGPLARELALGETETPSADNLELAIRDLQQNGSADAIKDIKTQIQTINESLLTIQTMIVSLTANKPEEIQQALDYINQRSQKHQMLVAELTELDTPCLSDLQERLRQLQQKEMAEPVLEKEQKEPEHER